MRPVTFTFMALLLAGAAHAAPVGDAATGLAVDPPAGYAVQAEAPDQRHTARLSIRRADDTDGGCQLGFAPTAANARLSQQQIDELSGSAAVRDAARVALSAVYDVSDVRVADFGPVRGLELQADFKPRPELPARARQLRSYFAILETPRGRTTLACVAERDGFAARLAEFGRIARSVTPP